MSGGPSVGRQALYAFVSTALALGVAEAVVRFADGGALPQIDCYEQLPASMTRSGTILLEAGCNRTLGRPDGQPWTLEVDAERLRAVPPGPAGPPWLVVGDSQVLGMNVDAAQTAVALLGTEGVAVRGVGVPGHGVEDALAFAVSLLGQPLSGLVLVVNGANDWSEAGSPVTDRYTEVNGWLVPPDRVDTVAGRFFATPLSRLHLLTYGVVLVAHDWSQDPAEKRWTDSPWGLADEARGRAAGTIGLAIRAFHDAWPRLPLRIVLLPVDFSTSEARARVVLPPAHLAAEPWRDSAPWRELQAEIGDLPYLDLGHTLTDSADFLVGDYHLSPEGHAKMAHAVAVWLAAEPPP